MPSTYTSTDEAADQAHDAAERTNGLPPAPAPADPIETLILAVDRCLGRTPADQRYRRTLAAWLATRHPEHPEAWWLGQWGVS